MPFKKVVMMGWTSWGLISVSLSWNLKSLGNLSIFLFTAWLNALVVVPSVLEAHDIIEMDEIERDLGF